MGHSPSLCCCLGAAAPRSLDDMDSKTTPMLYRPPQATVVPVDSSKRNPFAVMQSSLTLSSNLTPTPPSFFRRLDAYIHANNLRAWDVFVAMDLNQDKRITLEDLLDGLHQINFDLSPTEKSDLVDWMHEAVASDGLSFKEFTLALKLRSTLSPIRSKQSKSI
ncbi:hypothetical protein AeRB84_002354 [Aphanomyces euteiches]|nr:hypothetical protein AeRB84_002354 [Aphanomyces euteiches]